MNTLSIKILSLELLEKTFTPREIDYKTLEVSSDKDKKSIKMKLLMDESLREQLIE